MFLADTIKDFDQKNLEKRQRKEDAKNILETTSGTTMMASLAQEGGPIGRRISRELRKYESTGKISSWLAGQTTKAELQKEVPSAVSSNPPNRSGQPMAYLPTRQYNGLPFGGLPKYKPEVPSEQPAESNHPWKITLENTGTGENPIWKYRIEPESKIFDGYSNVVLNIDGVDGELNSLVSGDIFIEIILNEDGSVDEAAALSASSTGSKVVVTSGSNPYQTTLRQIIASVEFEDNVPIVYQKAWQNFSLVDGCFNGVPVRVTVAT